MKKFFVCSLSACLPDSIEGSPMWSYYGGNHSGLCIEFPFDAVIAANQMPIEPARYDNQRFDLSRLDPQKMRITSPRKIGITPAKKEYYDPDNNIDILELTRKSKAWEHEQEWRYIWSKNIKETPEQKKHQEKLWGKNYEHLALVAKPTRVILGSKMNSQRKAYIHKTLQKVGITTVDARLSPTENRVIIDEPPTG